jgi:acyl carrier protein
MMMTTNMQSIIISVLEGIAPEVDLADVDPDENLQDELDIDSIDYVSFIEGLYEKTGIEIPERDYPKLASLNACVSYLMAKAA